MVETVRMTASKLSDVSSLDSGADSGLYSMDSISLDRSVGEIRSSLQDKVTRLRQDKILVDEKIRQAQVWLILVVFGCLILTKLQLLIYWKSN